MYARKKTDINHHLHALLQSGKIVSAAARFVDMELYESTWGQQKEHQFCQRQGVRMRTDVEVGNDQADERLSKGSSVNFTPFLERMLTLGRLKVEDAAVGEPAQ